MNTFDRLHCPYCKVIFSFQNTPKILKNCEHSVCLKCLKIYQCSKQTYILECPIDSCKFDIMKYGLRNYLTNTAILEELRTGIDQKNKETQLNFQKLQKKSASIMKQKTQSYESNTQTLQMCLLHSKIADLICKKESTFVCSTCALFGDHKGHEIISYQQLLKNITKFTDEAFKAYQQIKEKNVHLSKKNIDEYIQSEIKKFRQAQVRNIRTMFQKLIEKIRKIQKQSVKKLDKMINISLNELKQNFISQDLDKKCDSWTKQIHKLTSVVDNIYNYKQIPEALNYLNQNREESFVGKTGEYLMVQLNSFEHLIENVIQERIKQMKCKYNENFFEQVEQFCLVNVKSNQTRVVMKQIEESHQKMMQRMKLSSELLLSVNKDFYCSPETAEFNEIRSLDSEIVKKIQTQAEDDEDFLLDVADTQLHQLKEDQNHEITFEQKYSIIKSEDLNQKQTPILFNEENSSFAEASQTTILQKKVLQIEPLCYNNQSGTILSNQDPNETIKSNNNCLRRPLIQNNLVKIPSRQSSRSSRPTSQLKKKLFLENETNNSFAIRYQNYEFERPVLNILNENALKRKKKIQIPQKYKIIWQQAKGDRCQTIDLTNAELGDTIILNLCEYLSRSLKARNLKLIRNKLTDEVIFDLLNSIKETNITSINLSQNGLTEKSLQIMQLLDLGNLKTITLSLNKINGRIVKNRIESFKQKGITISI